ncbi:asparagine synthase-related protein [Vibrio furnissii]|uniref:asparagine synthase-related protein n=1 Tax=Vibrio furnissii TaxID=29494 RepID=UPI001EEA649A|nr:asparagine synthase-related protein [Vibrio furnissii]MCG6212893.1 asparagine synthase-related protein [Vibrio furnissii]
MFKYYDCLGSRSFYTGKSAEKVYSSFADCINAEGKGNRQIDETALLSILMKNYSIGDKTLVKGIDRTPWMSRQDESGIWIDAKLPMHGGAIVDSSEACKVLHKNLRQEVLDFVSDKNTVGILLSGGMDSRIVAGIVRELQESGDYPGRVIALTWGIPESRDVVYAKRIADEFGWDFEHFELNADVLKQNIELTAERGAEYSPVHLHAMEKVSSAQGVDGVLAGSYGDSIGRGEYSGRRTNKLPGILDKHLNHFAFMSRNSEKKAIVELKQVLADSRKRFPGRDEMAYREIEMQMHYMRRQLNACMEVIDDKIPLYQMFSSPTTFGYMWSLASESRSDDVYEALLASLPAVLREIPWARTGRKYNQSSAPIEDDNTALNNRYGLWLRTELRSYVVDLISNGSLQSLGVFNNQALKTWANKWPKNDRPKADRLDEKMAWLASLSLFVEKYDIQPACEGKVRTYLEDSIHLSKALIHTKLYHEALKWKR